MNKIKHLILLVFFSEKKNTVKLSTFYELNWSDIIFDYWNLVKIKFQIFKFKTQNLGKTKTKTKFGEGGGVHMALG